LAVFKPGAGANRSGETQGPIAGPFFDSRSDHHDCKGKGSIGHDKADSRWPAWWEAIPVEKAGDLFKLRWRDNTNVPPTTRPRFELALICPDAT
jgi:hypothetical protein